MQEHFLEGSGGLRRTTAVPPCTDTALRCVVEGQACPVSSERVRAAQFITALGTGGAARAVVGLSEGLQTLGHTCRIYTYEAPPAIAARDDVHVFPGPPPRVPGPPLRLTSLEQALRRDLGRIDAVVLNGVFVPANTRVERLARGRTSTVASPFDPYNEEMFSRRRAAKRTYWAVAERPYLRAVDLVAVSCPSHAMLLRQRGVRTPTVVCPGALTASDVTRATAIAQSRRAGRPKRVSIGYLGRLDVHKKGVDLLLRAFASPPLTGSGSPDLHLAGPSTLDQRRIVDGLVAELGIADRIHLLGELADTWEYLGSLDALVLPSRVEGFGLVILEALAAGLPVLATRGAGAFEYLADDPAVIWCDASAEGLATALVELADRIEDLQEAARRASARVVDRFAWTQNAERLIEAIQKV